MALPETSSGSYSAKLNANKLRFLRKIALFCKARGIRVAYAHGPILRRIGIDAGDFAAEVNRAIVDTGIEVVPEVVLVDDEHRGDAPDHVGLDYKRLYTWKYFELLKPHLNP